MDHGNTKNNPESTTSIQKTTILPATVKNYSATEDDTIKSPSTHQLKQAGGKKALKIENSSSKSSSSVTPATKEQLNFPKLQESVVKNEMDSTKNLFTNFSMHQCLKSNPMLQGLTGNCDKTWPVPLFQNTDKPKEIPTTTCCSLAKGVCSIPSISSSTTAQNDKTKPTSDTSNKPCSACSSSSNNNSTGNTTNMLTNQNNFFKTAHSTMCIPQPSSSVIISSPFKHLMVGPKISNMPTPFNRTVNNNSTSTSCQQTPMIDKNANQEKNCKILFHSGKGENVFTCTPAAEKPGAENANNCNEHVPCVLNSKSSTSEHKSSKAHLATMDPEQLAIIRQRKRDRKFRKLQSLSALMRAPDDRHSMGPLMALKREIAPNKILGLSAPNLSPKLSSLSPNPFNRSSLTGNNQLNKLSVNNPWKGENTKKPCSFIHEPSLKNSAILSQTSPDLPKRKFDYQKDMNSSNSNFGSLNIWKPMENAEPVKEIRPSSTSSVIDDALRIAALKFIKNEVKDKDSATQKETTPISAEIFGSNKIKTPNFFLPRSKEDNYSESPASSSGEDSTKEKSNNMANVWLEEEKSRNLTKPVARPVNKSRNKRTSNVKKKKKNQINDSSPEQNRPLARDLKRPAENLSDQEASVKETDKIYPENKRSKVSEGAKDKLSSVIPKKRGRPPLSNKLKALKSVKRRGRPPLLGALKAKLQQRAVKSQRNYNNKRKLAPSSSKIPRRRGRPPKNPNAPPLVPTSKPEIPKLTDEDLLKVKLNIPRKRGRPSKAEAMLREMAVAQLAAAKKANTDDGEFNIGLGLTIRPRPARKQSSTAWHNCQRQQPDPVEDTGSYAAKKIKSEPVSSEESTSGDVTTSAKELPKDVEVETKIEVSHNNLAHTSSTFDKGQRKRKPVKKYQKNDPDYVNNRNYRGNKTEDKGTPSTVNETKAETAEEENGVVPANRSRPLLLRNVKKNSKPLPTFTDSDDSDVEESTDVEYKTPQQRVPPQQRMPLQQRVPIPKMIKPPIKICTKPAIINPPPTGQLMPPIYKVPRVLLPPSIKDTGIPCKMCGKVHTQDHFFKYMELKSTDQPHRCPLCGQYFTWSCLFIEHMRSHSENTAQYRCEYCNAVSRKISAYFNCRITHCPPSKEWLELQKTCDEYLASLNEAKEKKNSRLTKMIARKIVKPLGTTQGTTPGTITVTNAGATTVTAMRITTGTTPVTTTGTVSKNFPVNMSDAKDKNIRFPKLTPNKIVKADLSSSTANTTITTTAETKDHHVNQNDTKDKKNVRCAKTSSNKVAKADISSTTTEIKDMQEKLQMNIGKTKSRNSGRKNPVSKKPFECKVCRKTFLTFDFLTKHKQLHKSKRRHTCKKCGRRFATRSYFTVHKRTYHGDGEETLKCEVCNMTFSYILAYNNHKNRLGQLSEEEHRKRSLQPHVCDICQRGFKIKQSLINHVRTHTGERPFICEVCNKGFTQTGSLDRHRRIHQRDTREKPRRQEKGYSCKPCKKTFTYELAYQNHMQSHADDNRFYCDFCEQSFPTAQLLKNHKHNEQRPFKCKNCGRCYKHKRSLTEHKQVCSL